MSCMRMFLSRELQQMSLLLSLYQTNFAQAIPLELVFSTDLLLFIKLMQPNA